MTINRQVNKNITKEYYFNNNGEGFNSPHVITIGGLNIKVEVYSHNLTEKELTKVETYIKITANDFNKFFKLGESSSEQTFKIYIFGNRDDYTNLGGNKHFDFGLGEEGGMCFHRGEPDVFAEMYVYQKGNGVLNLQHEFAHGLTYYATKGMPLPNVLMEGVAEFFEYHGDDNDISHMKQDIDHILYLEGQNRKSLQNKGLNLDNFDLYKVLSLSYSAEDGHKNHLVYTMGHTLMKYLTQDHPNIIREYVYKVSTGSLTDAKEWLQQELKGHNQLFKEWLQKAKSMDLESFKKLFNSDDGYQNDQAADISRPSISKEDEYNTLRKEYDKLSKEHTSKLKKYNEERSEGDFRAIDDMQEIDTISKNLWLLEIEWML